jgi:hypothetical protein
MKAISPMEKRGAEYAQESAKTDGMSKGAATQGAGGSDGNNDALGMRGGKEYAQESAKTDGLCK